MDSSEAERGNEERSVAPRSGRKGATVALVVALCIFTCGLIWTAWLADDAFITFRCMDNFVHGRGLGWNLDERVQAFTNPLWLLLLAPFYALTNNLYWVAICAGFSMTAVALAQLVRMASGPAVAALGVLMLAGSKAFLEYSTSGLENPLLHVAVLFGVAAFLAPGDPSRRAGRVAFASSVAFLTRPDALLITGVLCVAAWLAAPNMRTTRRMLIGWIPAFAWEAFSIIYFGTWVPNTAIAKLSGDLPRGEVIQQGLSYLGNSVRWDPLTLITVAAAVLAFAPRPGRPRSRESVVVLALVLHLAYVVSVGGDFMTGRFLTSTFVVSVALLVRLRPGRRALLAATLATVVLATVAERSPWRSRPELLAFLEATEVNGITDERAVYYTFTGVVSEGHPVWGRLADGDSYPPADYARMKFEEGERVQLYPQVGMLGCMAPPELHIIDVLGLGDPLLARLPLTTPEGDSLFGRKLNGAGRIWRIGHLTRGVPPGYRESVESNENRIKNPALARYYGAIRSLTRAPIWSRERWRVLFDFHRGRYAEDLAQWRRDQTIRVNR